MSLVIVLHVTAVFVAPFTFNSSVRTDLNTYHQGLVHYAAHQMEKLRKDDQASDRQRQQPGELRRVDARPGQASKRPEWFVELARALQCSLLKMSQCGADA